MAEDNKTEAPTPKQREKARNQGRVVRSREFTGVLAIAGVLLSLNYLLRGAVGHWTMLYRSVLEAAASGSIESNGPVLYWSSIEVFRWIVPVLVSAMALSLAANFAQSAPSIATEALTLNFGRFNPGAKLGQLFSPLGMSNLLKSLIPFAAIAWIGFSCFSAHWAAIAHASSFGLRPFAALVSSMVYEVGWKGGLVLLLWSGVDYAIMRYKMESDLKMTKQEVKDEYKQNEGSPVAKNQMRRQRRALRRKMSLKATKTATVVVTNPTHYAVALRYETDMDAPVVVSKGLDLLALEIKQVAVENGIMVMENKPLAQALYKSVEVGDAIPAQLYKAVADVLVVVFRAQAEARAQEARRRSRDASGRQFSDRQSQGRQVRP